jgi:hypothetical protein
MSLADNEIVRILERYTETVRLLVMMRGAMKKIWVSAFGFIILMFTAVAALSRL